MEEITPLATPAAPTASQTESWISKNISFDDFKRLHPRMCIKAYEKEVPEMQKDGTTKTVKRTFRFVKELFYDADGKPMTGVTLACVAKKYDPRSTSPKQFVVQNYFSINKHTGEEELNSVIILCNTGADTKGTIEEIL